MANNETNGIPQAANRDSIFDDIILIFQNQRNVVIPNYIKNILKLCGFDSQLILSQLDIENDVKFIEGFCRNTVPQMFKESLELYLGPFSSCPEAFIILPGFKKMLLELKSFCLKKVNSPRNSQKNHVDINSNTIENKKKRKSGNKNIGQTSNNQQNESDKENERPIQGSREDENSKKERKIKSTEEEIDLLLKRIVNWIETYAKELNLTNDQEEELISKASEKTKISLDAGNTGYFIVACCICPKPVKIYKATSGTWLISNFQKHFKTHSHVIKKTNKRPRLNYSILNYVEKPPAMAIPNSMANSRENSDNISKSVVDNDVLLSQNEMFSGMHEVINDNDHLEFISLEEPREESSTLSLDFQTCRLTEEDSKTCVALPSSSKWKSSVYSRSQRNIRSLEKYAENSYVMTDFYDLISSVQEEIFLTLSKDKELKKSENIFDLNEHGMTYFLKTLYENIKSNSKNHGQRYDMELKKFCTYLFMIGGPILYNTLQSNMKDVLPCSKTLKRIIEQEQVIEEGSFRFRELKSFLLKRKYPLEVWLSEDQTAINNRIQYCEKNNSLVGFVPHLDGHGMPIVNGFPFNSLNDLENYFSNETKSVYINVIVAQPLVDKSPSFCLCVYGTKNKFSSVDVEKRWINMIKLAQKEGIIIKGYSTDGDCRMLKVMKSKMGLPRPSENSCWFFAKNFEEKEPLYVQDTVHIGTKLKTVFLKPGVVLPLGNYFISSDHLQTLIDGVSKDKHFLTKGDLIATDKMNFNAVEKITSPNVISNLIQHVPDSKATAIFLNMCQYILDTFLCNNLRPKERLYKIWTAVFFFRIWRDFISRSSEYTLTNNFITLNCYTCIEINAHSLILFMKRCRQTKSDCFLPWLLSSQPCEKMFRQLRSMTSTNSTVVNFSMLDVLRRLNRLNLMNEISVDAKNFQFPKEQHRRLGDNTPFQNEVMLNDQEIEETIESAWRSAALLCITVGIMVPDIRKPSIDIILKSQENLPDEYLEDNDSKFDVEIQPQSFTSTDESISLIEDDNLNILKNIYCTQESLNLKEYNMETYSRNSFLKIKLESGKIITVKKSSLCWLFQQEKQKLSSDRTLRVRGIITNSEKSKRKHCTTTKSKQTKKIKKTQFSSSSDDEISLHDSSSDGLETDDQNVVSSAIYMEIKKELYYAVYYDNDWYVGRTTEIMDDKLKMKFFKKSLYDFFWPK